MTRHRAIVCKVSRADSDEGCQEAEKVTANDVALHLSVLHLPDRVHDPPLKSQERPVHANHEVCNIVCIVVVAPVDAVLQAALGEEHAVHPGKQEGGDSPQAGEADVESEQRVEAALRAERAEDAVHVAVYCRGGAVTRRTADEGASNLAVEERRRTAATKSDSHE